MHTVCFKGCLYHDVAAVVVRFVEGMFRYERVHCPKTVGAATAAETEAKAEAEADNYKASKALRNLFACPAAAEGSGSGSGREAASSSIDLN